MARSTAPFAPASIRLPSGFRISLFADNLSGVRSMAPGPEGILFVGTRKAGRVYALVDRDRDFKADRTIVLAKGLRMPNGVAFRNGHLYVAEVHRVIRFENIVDNLNPGAPILWLTTACPPIAAMAGNSSVSALMGNSTSPWVRRAMSAGSRTTGLPPSCA